MNSITYRDMTTNRSWGPAVRRGRMVNRTSGDPSEQLLERHDASDFDTRTQDKIGKSGT